MCVSVRLFCFVFVQNHSQLALEDCPKPEAQSTLAALDRLGVAVWMITGDNAGTAAALGAKLGIAPSSIMAQVRDRDLSSCNASLLGMDEGTFDIYFCFAGSILIPDGAGADTEMLCACMVLEGEEISQEFDLSFGILVVFLFRVLQNAFPRCCRRRRR